MTMIYPTNRMSAEPNNVRRWKMPSFKCKDIGMKDSFEVKTENADELMPIIAIHADKTHNMKEPDAAMLEKIKKAIKK